MGTVGLILIWAVARLSTPAYVPHATGPVRRVLARRTIDGIVATGRLVDRMASYPSGVSMQGSITANTSVMTP